MDIKELHGIISGIVPEAGFIVVEHTYRNYSEMGNRKDYSAQFYADDNFPQDSLFMVNNVDSPASLIQAVRVAYSGLNLVDRKASRIAALPRFLAILLILITQYALRRLLILVIPASIPFKSGWYFGGFFQ